MKSKALTLGLTAGFHAFVFQWIGVEINALAGYAIPHTAVVLVSLAASTLTAVKLAPRIEGRDEPPASIIVLLLFAAGFYLFSQLLGAFGVGFGYGKFGRFAHDLARWSLIVGTVCTLRFVSHRVMLFTGLFVMALQFQAALALGLLGGLRIPKWVLQLISVAVAVWIARSFCVGDESPADRAKRPFLLWLFSALGVLAAMFTMESLLLRGWTVVLVWAAFLVSFLVLVSSIEPDDPTHARSALGANYWQMFLILVGMFSLVGGVFHIDDIVGLRLLFSESNAMLRWGPFLATLAVTIGALVWLSVGSRARDDGPGRTGLFWGVVMYFIALLAGGSLFGAASGSSRPFDFLAALLIAAVLVAPLMVMAQILMGVGLLRILFTLDPPRRD